MFSRVFAARTFSSLLILAMVGVATAQHPTFETGWIEALIGGAEYRAYTYATEVPANVTDGVTDERTLAVLQRVAGTVQHSASYSLVEPIMMGTMELTPATIYVALSTHTDHPDGNSVGSVLVEFSLDPETLELGDEDDVRVNFYPRGASYDDYYGLTQGTLELRSITVVNDHTYAVSGTISGLLSWQPGYDKVHNPNDTLTIEATFEVAQLVSSDAVIKPLTKE